MSEKKTILFVNFSKPIKSQQLNWKKKLSEMFYNTNSSNEQHFCRIPKYRTRRGVVNSKDPLNTLFSHSLFYTFSIDKSKKFWNKMLFISRFTYVCEIWDL